MTLGSINFIPNPAFEAQQARDPASNRAVEDYAEQGKRNAVSIGWSIADTGDYARSIRRDGKRVYSVDPGSMAIEFGSRNNRAFAPLRRGADETGTKVE